MRVQVLTFLLLATPLALPPSAAESVDSTPGSVRVWHLDKEDLSHHEDAGLYLFTDIHTATDPVARYLRGRVDGAWRRFDFADLEGFRVLEWEDRRRARILVLPRGGDPVVAQEVMVAPLGGLWGARSGRLKLHGSSLVAVDFAPFGETDPPEEVPSYPATLDAPGRAVRVSVRKKDGGVMVWIPPGPFVMGHEEGGPPSPELDDARPAHRVELPGFWIDRTEVTVAQWRRYMDSGGPPPEGGSLGEGEGEYPVRGVTWDQARCFCIWAGARLPREAEWEKAARGPASREPEGGPTAELTEGREFPWGEVLPGASGTWRANVRTVEPGADGWEGPAPVGSFPGGTGPWGTRDQAGNVREWVADVYRKDTYRRPGRSLAAPVDGEGPHVLRGGGFQDRQDYVRSWFRVSGDPRMTLADVGFRCARDGKGRQ